VPNDYLIINALAFASSESNKNKIETEKAIADNRTKSESITLSLYRN
jgi:hypothetical protein